MDDDGEGTKGSEQPTFYFPLVDIDEWLSLWLIEHEVSEAVDWLMSFVGVPVSSLLWGTRELQYWAKC